LAALKTQTLPLLKGRKSIKAQPSRTAAAQLRLLGGRSTRYLATLERRWKVSGLRTLKVVANPALTRTVARYIPATRTVEFKVALATRPDAEQREALCHEAAHAVVWDRFGQAAKPHGREWAQLVQTAGFEPVASLVRCDGVVAPSRATAMRYLHSCPVCHFSARAGRRMSKWRCPDCIGVGLPGILTIERLDPTTT